MPRLIILLLALASLTTLTVQNLGEDKAVSLTILGTPLSPIPLGLLLIGAIGAGALITLILYGLVGLHRPATSATKSKYQPIGSRVPYPDTPSTTAPSADSSYSTPPASATYGSGNSAFVTEPPVDKAGSTSTNPQTSSPDSASVPDSSPQASPSTSSPAAPSNVYSPFSRNQDADAKKKGPATK